MGGSPTPKKKTGFNHRGMEIKALLSPRPAEPGYTIRRPRWGHEACDMGCAFPPPAVDTACRHKQGQTDTERPGDRHNSDRKGRAMMRGRGQRAGRAPQNRDRMGCRTGTTERDDAKAAWNHASLPFGGSSTWVLNVVGEIVPSLIRLGTIVSYHFKIQTIVDGHCVVM